MGVVAKCGEEWANWREAILDGKIKEAPAHGSYVIDLDHDSTPSFLKPCCRSCKKTAVFWGIERQPNVQIRPQQAIAHIGERWAEMGYSAAEFAGFPLDARF